MNNLFAEDWEEPAEAEAEAVDEALGQIGEDALAGEDDETEPGLGDVEMDEALEAEELETEEALEEEPVEEEEEPGATAVEERERAADDDEGEVEGEVEAGLDEILRVQFAREEEEPDVGVTTPRRHPHHEEEAALVPRRPDEFVCGSCFLVKRTNQLADPDHLLCRDCA